MSNSSSSYGPDEPLSTILFEKEFMESMNLEAIAYGIHLCTFWTCVYYLGLKLRKAYRPDATQDMKRQRLSVILWFCFICVMLLSGTMNFVGNSILVEQMFIDYRNAPGGPIGWVTANYFSPLSVMGNVGYVIGSVFADGLLIWRTATVWDSWVMVMFPILMYLGSISLGIVGIYQTSRPLSNLWTKTTVSFLLPYFSLSVSLNVILTLLIVGRLQYMRHLIKKSLGHEYGRLYTSLTALVVESAALYSICALIFIGTYAANNRAQDYALEVLAQVMCISPELIILRVTRGQAWDRSTMVNISTSTIPFHHQNGSENHELATIARRNKSHGPNATSSAIIRFKTTETDDQHASVDETK